MRADRLRQRAGLGGSAPKPPASRPQPEWARCRTMRSSFFTLLGLTECGERRTYDRERVAGSKRGAAARGAGS